MKIRRIINILLCATIITLTIPINSLAKNNIINTDFGKVNFTVEQSAELTKFNEIMNSNEAKLIMSGLENYQQYYYIDNEGYKFTEDAKEVIPDNIYNLLKEVFISANEEFAKKDNEYELNLNSLNITSNDGVTPMSYVIEENGYNEGTYYYYNGNFDIGHFYYISDEDTDFIVNSLIVSTVVSYILGKLLSLWPPTALLGMSFEATSVLCAAGSAYVSNMNNGYGIFIRIYSGGAYIGTRSF